MNNIELDDTFLQHLNADCIFEVFKYLDIYDIVKLSLLNERMLSLVTYHLRNVNCVHDLRLVHRKALKHIVLIEENTTTILHFIAGDLRRIGQIVESIELKTMYLPRICKSTQFETSVVMRFPNQYLQLLEECCAGGNLRHLSLKNVYASPYFVRRHILFGQLTSVCFHNVRIREYILGNILSLCTAIQQLKLRKMNVSGVCLRRLPLRKLEEITVQLTTDANLDPDVLMGFVRENPQLTAINLNEPVLRAVMPDLMQYYHTLTSVEFDSAFYDFRYRSFDGRLFDGLKWDKLKRLFISRYIIDERVLWNIGQLQCLEVLGLVENLEQDVDHEQFGLMISQLSHLKSFCYISNSAMSEERFLNIILNGWRLQDLVADVNQFRFTDTLLQRISNIVKMQNKTMPLQLILRNEQFARDAALNKAIEMNRHIIDVKSIHYFDATDYNSYCT